MGKGEDGREAGQSRRLWCEGNGPMLSSGPSIWGLVWGKGRSTRAREKRDRLKHKRNSPKHGPIAEGTDELAAWLVTCCRRIDRGATLGPASSPWLFDSPNTGPPVAVVGVSLDPPALALQHSLASLSTEALVEARIHGTVGCFFAR